MTLDEWNIECQKHLINEFNKLKLVFNKQTINYLDIGANVGVLYDLLKLEYNIDQVIMIEPDPIMFNYLNNKFKDIECTLINAAITDKDKNKILFQNNCNNADNYGLNKVDETYGSIEVNNISFDKFLNENKSFLEIVDYIKMDTENYDWCLMEVLYNFLNKNNLRPLIGFENNWINQMDINQAEKIYNLFIDNLGYKGPKFHSIDSDILLHL